MAEDLNLSAKFTADIANLERGINSLIDDAVRLQIAVGGADKNLNAFEKSAARAGGALRAASGGVQQARLTYEQLSKAQGQAIEINKRFDATRLANAGKTQAQMATLQGQAIEMNRKFDAQRVASDAATQAKINAAHGQALEINKRFDATREAGAKKTAESEIRAAQTAEKQKIASAQRAAAAVISAAKAEESALIRERYALYDVASTYGIVSAALLAASGYAVKTAADFESAFTAVERTLEDGTSQAAIAGIRSELVDLSTTIPKTFADISQIATLGNQLGIASEDLTTFTETVSQFSTITGITAEASAQAFGRIGNILGLLPAEYDNLASAIVYVGRTSAATEAQIISLTERLGATASRAGFTADQVVGLAGALASVGVAPERAQGVLETYFNTLNEAVVSGGAALQNFSVLTGMSADEITRLVDSGGGLQIFQKVLQSLGDTTNSQTTAALEELGLTGLRVNEVIPRLANNFGLFEKSLSNSSKAYSEATELSSQYSLIADDLNTQFQLLVNSVNALIEELSGGLVPGLAGAVGGLVEFVNSLREVAKNPVVQVLAGLVLGLTAMVGVLFAVKAATALTVASSYALSTAFGTQSAATSATLVPALGKLIASLFGVRAGMTGAAAGGAAFAVSGAGVVTSTAAMTAGATAAAVAMSVLRTALLFTGVGAALVGVGVLVNGIVSATQTAEQKFTAFVGSTGGLADALAADTEAYRATGEAITTFKSNLDGATTANSGFSQSTINLAKLLGNDVPDAASAATGKIEAYTVAIGDNTIAWLRNQLATGDAFKQLAGNTDFVNYFTTIGANLDDVLAASAAEGEQGVVDYFARLEDAATSSGVKFQSAFRTYLIGGTQIAGVASGGNASGDGVQSLARGLDGLTNQAAILGITGVQAAASIAGIGRAFSSASNAIAGVVATRADIVSALGAAGASAGGAAKKVRTLVDYANDLGTVFKRSFDIQFGSQSAIDDVTSSFQDLADGIRDAQNELLKLTADKNVKEYFLSVANAYGDTLRAGILTGEIADINAKIAETQADASTELTGNSKAAIKNRKTVTGLVSEYQDYIQALAASGADQTTLNAAVAQSQADFIAQATALGYSTAQLQPYIASFRNMATVIGQVPRNITVTANTNPALQSLNEFVAAARAAGTSAGGAFGNSYAAAQAAAFNRGIDTQIYALQAGLTKATANGAPNLVLAGYINQISALKAQKIPGYADGGYTGAGGKYETAGVVHRGEYVVPKHQVNQRTGLPYANALGGVQRGSRGSASSGYAGGGFVGAGGMGVVSLSPTDRGLIRDMARQTVYAVLAESPAAMAQYVRTGNKQLQGSGVS